MPKYPRPPRSVYMQSVETAKQLEPRKSLGIWVLTEMETETVMHVKQFRHPRLSGGYMVVIGYVFPVVVKPENLTF